MSFRGLSIATSGIRAAQLNLSITGHNISNSEIKSYSRQRIVQQTAFQRSVGISNAGDRMIVGMGTDWNAVHQIRNEFLDFSYRENVGRLSFHSTKVQVGLMMETFLGELHGGYNFQTVIDDMWYAIQELSTHPDGIETRAMLLATANTFLNKAQSTMHGITEYQYNLDEQIRAMVTEINENIARIEELNVIIRGGEVSGDNANDFRDERNRLLDRLAEMIPTEVFIAPDGDVAIMSMGHQMLSVGVQNILGLKFTSADYSFVEPVFTRSDDILAYNTHPSEFTSWTNYRRPINNEQGNDLGALNALLSARGAAPAHKDSDLWQQYWDPSLSFAANIVNLEAAATAAETAAAVGGSLETAVTTANTALTTAVTNLGTAQTALNTAQAALDAAQAALDVDPSNAALIAARNAALAARNTARDARDAAQIVHDDALRDVAQAEMDLTMGRATALEYRRRVNDFEADQYNWRVQQWSIQHAQIPQIQKNLDRIVNSVFTMMNDMLTGNLRDKDGNLLFPGEVPLNLNGDPGIPLFIRIIDEDPLHPDVLRPENVNDIFSIHTIKNWTINPEFLKPGGHNLLALSFNGDPNDNRLMNAMQEAWNSNEGPYAVRIGEIRFVDHTNTTTVIRAGAPFNIQDSYIRFTGSIATDITEANKFVASQTVLTQQADSLRVSTKGVSMDEELNAMLRFQFAFQSAARVLNVIDGMIETIIGLGGR